METYGDFWNKEPKIIEIYGVVDINRTYGREQFYAYFTTEEKATKWLNENNEGHGGRLEVVKIKVA